MTVSSCRLAPGGFDEARQPGHAPRATEFTRGPKSIDFDGLKNVASGGNVDQAAEFAKSRFGQHSDKIDAVAGKGEGLPRS
ncbi:hypothetical protein [Amycolatopsis sp. SID8362]|uniref:hypothetical protein n=1 Tax=Amycolatopsis sp. SID8362 TaxID=2690346 RepID=UPI001EF19EB4|nr:hypothetical protein [Amycolatopsis sp. SID8362]